MYKYQYQDTGYCRVYHKKGRNWYCIQDDGSGGVPNYKFYSCTNDGEPSHKIPFPDEDQFDSLVYPK